MRPASVPFRVPAAIQSIYFLVTGLWPLVHIQSFLAVTGPKDDIWLVETVAVLVASIGAALGLSAIRAHLSPEIAFLAITSAIGLAVIDTIYVLRGRIDPVYLADVTVEAAIVAGWMISMFRYRTRMRGAQVTGRR